jgi:23S rRNA pseudouridine955/2504/2580 synthase
MVGILNNNVRYEVIDESSDGQKIDNYLIKIIKNVPKSHIYKLLRSGQVRVNKKRVKTDLRLTIGDRVRIPPFKSSSKQSKRVITIRPEQKVLIDGAVIYEDDALIAVNKPSGLAVHGGSGLNFGLIELLRHSRPEAKFLELVHRIDKETSGIILIAKKRKALVEIHQQMRKRSIHKKYQVMVNGRWKKKQLIVDLDLLKTTSSDGQKKVQVLSKNQNLDKAKDSRSVFFLREAFVDLSLLDVKLVTGRTHQIRVHLSHLGFPIVGDDKYGNFNLNKNQKKIGFKRMFLHAGELGFVHPFTEKKLFLSAPLPKEFIELQKYAKKH